MTGLIYVVIIALWAAVLIPMWLRRHDQISEVRSTARFSSAMKSLGGQGQPQFATESGYDMDEQYDMPMPRSSSNRSAREVRAMRPTTESRPPLGLDPTYERELARQAASTRRAIVLGSLTFILLLALVLAVAGMFPRWMPVLAAIPVVAFVLAAALTASERSAARPVAVRRTHQAERPARSERSAPVQAAPPAAAVDDDWETWNAWDDDESWDAVPQTLPTYVTAPRASQVPRGIDRSRPGEWTGEAMVETAQSMRTRERADALDRPPVAYGSDTAEIPVVKDGYGSQRAVNE
ncbi:MAG: hypothetical protein PSX37_04140 [bacterium]|nr:hypothetical protein [bacterium]